ncbi:DUF4381 family protein [Rickettsiales bacterium]|nr:DUF4381 family protein [Rickettsiales bacterium]
MNNEQLLNIIEDIYEIGHIGILPLSNFTYILITAIILFVIIAYLLRRNHLKKHPWLIELKLIKKQLSKKREIKLSELSIYIKKIASLKYQHNSLNKMSMSEISQYLSINEANDKFNEFLSPLATKSYIDDNYLITGFEYNNILKLIQKWI